MNRSANVTIISPLPLRFAAHADKSFTIVSLPNDAAASILAHDSALSSGAGSIVSMIGSDGELRFVSQPLSLEQLRAQALRA